MDTTSIDSKSIKTSDPHKLVLNPADKTYLNRIDKYVALSNFIIFCTWGNTKMSYKYKRFKLPATTWDKEFALPNWFLRISNIQGYFDFFIKNNETINDNSPMQVYVNQNEKSVTFKIKSEC